MLLIIGFKLTYDRLCREQFVEKCSCSLNTIIKKRTLCCTEDINISALDMRDFLNKLILYHFAYRACRNNCILMNASYILEIESMHFVVYRILCGQVDWQIVIIRSHNTFSAMPTQSCVGSQSHWNWNRWLKMNLLYISSPSHLFTVGCIFNPRYFIII